jgi:hypothetical protein
MSSKRIMELFPKGLLPSVHGLHLKLSQMLLFLLNLPKNMEGKKRISKPWCNSISLWLTTILIYRLISILWRLVLILKKNKYKNRVVYYPSLAVSSVILFSLIGSTLKIYFIKSTIILERLNCWNGMISIDSLIILMKASSFEGRHKVKIINF